MSRWFRLYDDLLDDPKVQRLRPPLFKMWVNLLCLTSRNHGELPVIADIAFALRLDEETAKSALGELTTLGLIDDENGLRPHNWDKRQFRSDLDPTAAERQQAKRERDKGNTVTRDASVTSHPPEQSTESDTEKKIRTKTPKRVSYPPLFEDFWKAYPNEGMSKLEAGAEWMKLSDEDCQAAFNALPAFKDWAKRQGKDYRVVHAVRYLKHRRFDGFAQQANGHAVTVKQVPVEVDTPAWKAWNTRRKYPVTDLHVGNQIKRGWYFPTEYPPHTQENAA